MADPTTGTAPHCQWCSAPLPAADLDTCPSCGATLSTAPDTGEIRGVTTLDTEAILRSRSEASRPRSRLLSFITGEEPVELGGPEEAESLAPPDDAVRLEMLRLQFEAERADLEAESIANKTDTVLDEGIDLAALGGASPADELADVQAAQAGTPVPAPATPTAPTSPTAQPVTPAPSAAPPAPPAVPAASDDAPPPAAPPPPPTA
jgi:hypothetical protein